jgi:tetratricopeptide (TPR) repeat protein
MGSQPDGRRRLWIGGAVVAIVAGVAVAVFARGHRVRPDEELNAATDALRHHDPAAARIHLDRVLAENPTDRRALLLAAQAARRADDCAQAERLLTALDQGSRLSTAAEFEWLLLGVQQGDFGTEEARLRSDVDRHDPSTPEILEAMAKGYEATVQFPDALLALDALIEREPGNVPARVVRGRVRARIRQFDGAEDDLRAAVRQAPESAQAHLTLAAVLNRRGHTREAIYHFEIGRQTRPNDVAARLGLARAFADGANLPSAERTLDELLNDDPDHPDALVERARIALRQNRSADAEPLLARAIAVAPWHRDGHRLYLLALRDLGRTDAVAQEEARLAKLTAEDGFAGRLKLRARDNRDDVGTRWELYQWAVRNGDREESLAWLTEVLRADPNHAAARAAIADHFEKASQPRRSAKYRAGGRS